MSKEITTHIKALSKVQKDLKHAKKDDKGAFGKYADLATVYDAIKAPLASNGFAYCHEMINTEDGTLYVETHLLHESGGSFKTRLPIINQKRDMQGSRFGYNLCQTIRHFNDCRSGLRRG